MPYPIEIARRLEQRQAARNVPGEPVSLAVEWPEGAALEASPRTMHVIVAGTKRPECKVPSDAQLPTTTMPDEIAAQPTTVRSGQFEDFYRCKLCDREVRVTIEDYHVLYMVFRRAPCEE